MNNIRKIRSEQGITQEQLAEKMGVSPGQVSRWESGKTNVSLYRMIEIAQALGCEPEELIAGASGVSSASIAPNATVVPMEGPGMERMREDLPIFGTALGSARIIDGESVEQTYLNSGDVIQYAKRPVILNGRTDAYGLYVVGNSMAPAHMEGDMVLAETKRPPRIGDDCVIYLRPENEEEDDGMRARSVLIKRLVRRTAEFVEVEQFSPAKNIRLPAVSVVRLDRIMRLPDLIA